MNADTRKRVLHAVHDCGPSVERVLNHLQAHYRVPQRAVVSALNELYAEGVVGLEKVVRARARTWEVWYIPVKDRCRHEDIVVRGSTPVPGQELHIVVACTACERVGTFVAKAGGDFNNRVRAAFARPPLPGDPR